MASLTDPARQGWLSSPLTSLVCSIVCFITATHAPSADVCLDKTDRLPFFIDRRPSPGLSLPASSKNPFRNPGALSPGLTSPASNPGVSPRLSPTNPFLAAHEVTATQQTFVPAPVMTESVAQTQQRSPVDREASQLFVSSLLYLWQPLRRLGKARMQSPEAT